MVPHAGADSDLFRAVTALGDTLKTLAPVAGSEREPAEVGILFDWSRGGRASRTRTPTSLLDYHPGGARLVLGAALPGRARRSSSPPAPT